MPGQTLSRQRHSMRAEHWQVIEGIAHVEIEFEVKQLHLHDTIDIPVGSWHRLYNTFDNPCKIVEIQYEEQCVEEDIERVHLNK